MSVNGLKFMLMESGVLATLCVSCASCVKSFAFPSLGRARDVTGKIYPGLLNAMYWNGISMMEYGHLFI